MSLEPVHPEDDAGPPSEVDRRMVDILSGKSPTGRPVKDLLRDESSEQAEDLIGRLNAMEFIDSVIGEEVDTPGQIGEFEVQGVLGRGGMGTVYLAYQESLDREVALKVLAPRFSSDVTMRKRFRKEAKATAAMHHQHIVPIYDYGEAGGHLFFAMERVKGVSLDKHISAARRHEKPVMEPAEAARRFAGVADALSLAHKRQILHRDVKPGNLLVHDDGTLALADFGLSKFLGEVSHHLTSVGGFLGTLHYSPPEQARGEALCPASDLYSLGVTMFEAVTGRLPLSGDSTEAMLQSLLKDDPKRLRELSPKAPRDFEMVLEKLLHKDPRDRYQDGEALSLDLLRVAEGEPVRIRRQSLPARLYRRVKRSPVQAAVAVSMVVVLVITGLWLRSLVVNKEINRSVEGRAHLNKASQVLAVEPGLVLGPYRIASALTGRQHEEQIGETPFLGELAAAEELLNEPQDVETFRSLRRAYFGGVFLNVEGGDPRMLLVRGWGHKAVEVLTAKIDEIERTGRTFDDLAVRLNLYHLYLLRALAHLTAASADPDKAENDLRLASFIRSGAFLPRVLKVVAGWRAPKDPQRLIRSLQALNGGDPLRRRMTGELLCAVAGLCAPPDAHLMRFDLDHATRLTLHRQGQEWLGQAAPTPDPVPASRFAGLDAQLFEGALEMVAALGNTARMEGVRAEIGRTLQGDRVASDSRLQAWRQTIELLQNRSAALSTELMQLGSLYFLRVLERHFEGKPRQIAAVLTAETQARLQEAIERDPESMLALQITCRAAVYTGQPDLAIERSRAWLRRDSQDPEAYLYRFIALLDLPLAGSGSGPSAAPAASGELVSPGQERRVEAVTAATYALQYAARPASFRDRLLAQVQARISGPAGDGAGAAVLRQIATDLAPAAQEGESR